MQALPKLSCLTQGPTGLFHANVVFGHASRGLDHAAIQGISTAQLHEPQGGREGQESESAREIKTKRGETRQFKRHGKLQKTYQICNVVFQQSQANFQRTIPPTPPQYRQNVAKILPNGTQNAPQMSHFGDPGATFEPIERPGDQSLQKRTP